MSKVQVAATVLALIPAVIILVSLPNDVGAVAAGVVAAVVYIAITRGAGS